MKVATFRRIAAYATPLLWIGFAALMEAFFAWHYSRPYYLSAWVILGWAFIGVLGAVGQLKQIRDEEKPWGLGQ